MLKENCIAGNWRSNDKVKKSTKLPRHFTFFLNPYEFPPDFNIHFLLVPSTLIIFFLGGGERKWLKKWRPICRCQSFLVFSLFLYDVSLFARLDLHNGNPSAGTRELRLWLVTIHHRNEFPFYWFRLVTFRFLPNEKSNQRADDGRRVGWSNSKRIRNV